MCRHLTSTSAIERVIVLDALSTGSAENLAGVGGVEVQVGSILDEAALRCAADGAAAIVHLAARPSVPRSIAEPVASHLANATGTVNVLEAARRTGATSWWRRRAASMGRRRRSQAGGPADPADVPLRGEQRRC